MPRKSTHISRICPVCGASFRVPSWEASVGLRKTCSRVCAAKNRPRRPFEDRFWEKVSIGAPDECWEWQAARNNRGYGITSKGYHRILAHRASYTIAHGDIPDGKVICHTCDNPPCVNPRHLFMGDPSDNARDMVRKGRHSSRTKPESVQRGENVASSTLTEGDVRDIRSTYQAGGVTLLDLANQYNVTPQAIWLIVKRVNWRHID